jgi:hypothetical protein
VIALVIDEPENHFHESLLLELMTVLHSLTSRGGIANWMESNPAAGKQIKREWIQNEYKDHNLEQVLVATHSKSLIYKFFSLGKNFTVAEGITEIRYEAAEGELRHLGLSTIYSKVLLVEGDGDHHALEFVLKGENIKVKPLHGSGAVIDTFRRLAQVRQHVTDARFVFLVDSDNKPPTFFSKLQATNKEFYDESFVVLAVHEFENLFLNAALFELVTKQYLSVAGNEDKCPSLNDIQAKLVDFARKTLERVYKKELSLAFQQEIERHFAQAIWGNKSFRWDTPTEVNIDLATHITAHTGPALNTALMAVATQTYQNYQSMSDITLLARCDGKQALAEACSYFASIAGAKNDAFREALLKAGVKLKGNQPESVVSDLLRRMQA